MVRVVGIRFRKACKVYDFDSNNQEIKPGDKVIVEVDRGLGMGEVAYIPQEKDEGALSYKLKKVIRRADKVDLERQNFNLEREEEAFKTCRDKIKSSGLEMKLIRVEYLFDSSKAIFYFTSDGRIDFRELVRDLASRFHTRIEMRQIGVRDEAKVIGGIGPCGRELCCSNFLSNFAPVTVKMAKEQNLALNPTKISGICGRLMCCLSYEYRSYQKGKPADGQRKGATPCCAQKDSGGQEPVTPAVVKAGSEWDINDDRGLWDDIRSKEEPPRVGASLAPKTGKREEGQERPERRERPGGRNKKRSRNRNRNRGPRSESRPGVDRLQGETKVQSQSKDQAQSQSKGQAQSQAQGQNAPLASQGGQGEERAPRRDKRRRRRGPRRFGGGEKKAKDIKTGGTGSGNSKGGGDSN